MNISSLSTGTTGSSNGVGASSDSQIGQLSSSAKQRLQEFKALRDALKSGDLSAAQDAFETLKKDLQKSSQNNGGKNALDPQSPAGKELAALGDALKAGDLSAAQKSFETLQQGLRSARGHHHHHPDNDASGNGGANPASSPNASSLASAGLDAHA